jgi:hypothetical protein
MFVNTSEPKARSRISVIKKIDVVPVTTPIQTHHHTKRSRLRTGFSLSPLILKVTSFSLPSLKSTELSKKYQKAVPWLVLAVLLYSALVYVLNNVRPSSIADLLLYHSYIPIIFLFYFATFSLFKFIFLRQMRAVAVAFWLTLLLFLKLQSFEITSVLVLSSALLFVGIPVILPVLFHK